MHNAMYSLKYKNIKIYTEIVKLSPVDRDLAYLQALQYSKVYGAVQISPVDRDLAYLQVIQYSKVYGEVQISPVDG